MQDLIDQYREQLAVLQERKKQLEARRRLLRGAEYFKLLRRIDLLEQEAIEMSCTLAWMVKKYGDGPRAKIREAPAGPKRPDRKPKAACG